MGVLYLELPDTYHGSHTSFIEFLATQAAICLRKVELIDEVNELNQTLQEAERRSNHADTEIDMRRGTERHFKQLAETDELTQLANRRRFISLLEQAWSLQLVQQDMSEIAVMMIDIDHFKKINDHHGHATGDLVLIRLAELLRREIRMPDIAARVGGEEFALLLRNVTQRQAQAIGERLCQCVCEMPAQYGDQLIQITISVGLAKKLPQDGHYESLVQRADAALYRAKTQGRDRVSW